MRNRAELLDVIQERLAAQWIAYGGQLEGHDERTAIDPDALVTMTAGLGDPDSRSRRPGDRSRGRGSRSLRRRRLVRGWTALALRRTRRSRSVTRQGRGQGRSRDIPAGMADPLGLRRHDSG